LIFEHEKNETSRLMYLLTAKEMALRSVELKDTVFQALVAIQAYKFNKEHKGSPTDIDIYRALYKALRRYDNPITKKLSLEIDKSDKDWITKTEAMANELCSRLKRNMMIEEWNKFASHLVYESTCEAFPSNR
jgi:hypothetical protein